MRGIVESGKRKAYGALVVNTLYLPKLSHLFLPIVHAMSVVCDVFCSLVSSVFIGSQYLPTTDPFMAKCRLCLRQSYTQNMICSIVFAMRTFSVDITYTISDIRPLPFVQRCNSFQVPTTQSSFHFHLFNRIINPSAAWMISIFLIS